MGANGDMQKLQGSEIGHCFAGEGRLQSQQGAIEPSYKGEIGQAMLGRNNPFWSLARKGRQMEAAQGGVDIGSGLAFTSKMQKKPLSFEAGIWEEVEFS